MSKDGQEKQIQIKIRDYFKNRQGLSLTDNELLEIYQSLICMGRAFARWKLLTCNRIN